MLIRANEHAAGGDDLDLMHALKPIFENIAMAKVSTSAEEARSLGYLRPSDLVSMNRDRQVADAKADGAGDGSRRISSAGAGGNSRAGRGISCRGEAGDSHDAARRIRNGA